MKKRYYVSSSSKWLYEVCDSERQYDGPPYGNASVAFFTEWYVDGTEASQKAAAFAQKLNERNEKEQNNA